jgi:hypothetical protein
MSVGWDFVQEKTGLAVEIRGNQIKSFSPSQAALGAKKVSPPGIT